MDLLFQYSDDDDDDDGGESTSSNPKDIEKDTSESEGETEGEKAASVELVSHSIEPKMSQKLKIPTVDDLLNIVSNSTSSIRPEISKLNDSIILPSLKRHHYDDPKVGDMGSHHCNSHTHANSFTSKPSSAFQEPRKPVMSRERFLKLQAAAAPGASTPAPAATVGDKVTAKVSLLMSAALFAPN
ncbi:hypothetical protein EON64_04350 [archaeon]|nr:MAG: hypothetical protein EON64_04350 [archaeon]